MHRQGMIRRRQCAPPSDWKFQNEKPAADFPARVQFV
jgi:hypothetical protein